MRHRATRDGGRESLVRRLENPLLTQPGSPRVCREVGGELCWWIASPRGLPGDSVNTRQGCGEDVHVSDDLVEIKANVAA